MEFILLIWFAVAGFIYWRLVEAKNRRNEALLKEFVAHIVPCKVEKRDGEFFVYNGLNSQFLGQCKTGRELEDMMPLNKMYMSWDCERTVFDVIDDWENDCTPLKST